MSLLGAIDRLVQIEQSLSITEPSSVNVKAAYDVRPDMRQVIKDLPAFINLWQHEGDAPLSHSLSWTATYGVQVQCLVAPIAPELRRNARIATALWQAFQAAIRASRAPGGMLDGQARHARLRDGRLVRLEESGQAYIGFEATLELVIDD